MIDAFIEISWLEPTHRDRTTGRVRLLETTKEGDYLEIIGLHGKYHGYVSSLNQVINGSDTFLSVSLVKEPDEV